MEKSELQKAEPQRFAYFIPVGRNDHGTQQWMATLVRPLTGPVFPVRLTQELEDSLFSAPYCGPMVDRLPLMEMIGFDRVNPQARMRLTYLNPDDSPALHHIRMRDVREWDVLQWRDGGSATEFPIPYTRIRVALPWTHGPDREDNPFSLLDAPPCLDPFALEFFTPDDDGQQWLYTLFPKVKGTVKGCSATGLVVIHVDATSNPQWKAGPYGLTDRFGLPLDPGESVHMQHIALQALPEDMKWPEPEWPEP